VAGQVTQVGFAARAPVAYAVSEQSGSVRVFEVPSGRTLYFTRTPYVQSPSASLDETGRTLAMTVSEWTKAPAPKPVRKIVVVDTQSGRRIADLVLKAQHLQLDAQEAADSVIGLMMMPEELPVDWDAVGISPKGDRVLSADQQYGVAAWSVKTEQPIWLTDRTPGMGRPTKIVWSSDEIRAVLFEATATSGSPSVVDARSGRVVMRFEPGRSHGGASQDGSMLLGVGNGELVVLKPPAPTAIRELRIEESIYGPVDGALSADVTRAFVGGGSQLIREIELSSGSVARTFKGHVAGVSAVAASPDGRHLLSGSVDGDVRLWDLASGGEVIPPNTLRGGVLALSLAADGGSVIVVGRDSVPRTYALDGTPGDVLPSAETKALRTVAIGAKAGRLVLTDAESLLCRDLKSGRTVWQKKVENSEGYGFDVDASGNVLASFGSALSVLEAADGRARFQSVSQGWISAARFSSDGQQIAWSNAAAELGVFSAKSGKVIARLAGHRGPVIEDYEPGKRPVVKEGSVSAYALAFSPDGKLLASASSHDLALWQLPSGKRILRTDRDSSMRVVLEFSSDGRWLALGDDNGVLYVVDLTTQPYSVGVLRLSEALPNQESAITALAFLLGGSRLLAATLGGGLHELSVERAAR
jgi:WD40 repeat protein